MAALIARFLPLVDQEGAALARFARPTSRNWNDMKVGEVLVTEAI
jgi:L-asparaginase II